ncbi:YggS family pyridoxal phosphate-dependent enzyme [Enteractinococcus helveticum]|uniref:Pyridoxal phosphate homeostasis protein n=1 Tax=Enteractinococcus helveticum TaxID=1837282 RepID=A0A1B7M250_9MICC|nr:YggS family pyridoxal phosphate-dependent enzyme [Enteractinococcus helveticum]OAV62687.1 YggS family pyridoxal phosphate enzyme [Enteractinococcus helveticum]
MSTLENTPRVAVTAEDFRQALAEIHDKIRAAAQRAGRDPSEIRLLPVSKTVSEERIRAAHAAGMQQFGENKVQEAQHKATDMADLGIHWAIIGPLQSNKTRDVAEFAHEFQALDRIRIARRLNTQLKENDRTLDVYVQVNVSGEETKSGLELGEVENFLEQLLEFDALNVKGLMTMAIHTGDEAVIRHNFSVLRRLRDDLLERRPELIGEAGLSMGMTNDYEIAIEEGATVVRVGTAIFGERDYSE